MPARYLEVDFQTRYYDKLMAKKFIKFHNPSNDPFKPDTISYFNENVAEVRTNERYVLHPCFEAQKLSQLYDARKLYSWVIKLDPASFALTKLYTFICVCNLINIFEYTVDEIYNNHGLFDEENKIEVPLPNAVPFLGIIETTASSVHLHMTMLAHNPIDKKQFKMITAYLEQFSCLQIFQPADLKTLLNRIIPEIDTTDDEDIFTNIPHLSRQRDKFIFENKLIVTAQEIRSNAGYINYLHKDPVIILGNTTEVLEYFVHFDKKHIFTINTYPKFTNNIGTSLQSKILSDNPLVLLFYRLFNEGYSEYSDVLKVPDIQNYLHNPALKSIFNNCIQQYMVVHEHIDFIIIIMKRFLKLETQERCFCPLMDWFQLQEIDINEFAEKLTLWLNGIHKKNTLMFIGPPNGGKSHVARLLWQQFPFAKRIIQDGLFSFGNLCNAGCAIWEEPFIAPDLADTAKLVLEGEPDINIAIKNQQSVKLNKRVPMIITTNHEIYKYCSGQQDAFNERVHRIDCNYVPDYSTICKVDQHYCPYIGTNNCTPSVFESSSSKEDKRVRETSELQETCTSFHALESNHILSFIAFSLAKNITLLKPFSNIDLIRTKEKELYNILTTKINNSFCYCSNNLQKPE